MKSKMAKNTNRFLKDFIYFYREGKGEGKKWRETLMYVASRMPPIGDLAHNPRMCPGWESIQRPFGSQAGTQSTEPPQPGPPS